MPAQSTVANQEFYVENDTAPPLTRQLFEDDGEPIDLTGSEVTISIAFTFPRGSYYTSPRDQIVTRAPCVIVGDPTEGRVAYSPRAEGEPDDAFPPELLFKHDMSPPGEYLYHFTITQSDGRSRHYPRQNYLPMRINAPVGGRFYL